jgi:hypothetical protein
LGWSNSIDLIRVKEMEGWEKAKEKTKEGGGRKTAANNKSPHFS